MAGAALVALALGGVNPAFALDRLAEFTWAPASGPVAGYAVYASTDGSVDELVASVATPGAVIAVESSRYVSVRVAAYDSGGRLGPLSDASEPVRLCPGDFDGNEVMGFEDWTDARSCFGLPGTGFCAGADFDLDGTISLIDLQSVSLGANACPPTICPGDFDGDHVIGIWDYGQARACFGLPAEGACAAADFDGNGMVSVWDVGQAAALFGTDACLL